jgi:hypothetical protein
MADLNADVFFSSPEILARMNEAGDGAVRLARDVTRAIMESLDRAAARLYASGVAIDRIMLWQTEDARERGLLVDVEPGATHVDKAKACTITMRYDATGIVVETSWHEPWSHLNDMDPAGDEVRLAELRKLAR